MMPLKPRATSTGRRLLAVGVCAVLCCSCSSARRTAQVDPFVNQPSAVAATPQAPVEVAAGTPSAPKSESKPQATEKSAPAVPSTSDRPSAVQPVSHQAAGADVADSATMSHSADPRVPLPHCPVPSGYSPHGVGVVAELPSPEAHPDEYLFDGGDRDLPVHYGTNVRYGLETEDTIAEYADPAGRTYVQPSNRVAIYSPRFAAIRTVSEPVEGVSVGELANVYNSTRGTGMNSLLAPTQRVQREPAAGLRMRSRASGLETETAQSNVSQANAVALNERQTNLFQNIEFLKTGLHKQAEEGQLALGIQAASGWTHGAFPVISGQLQSPHEDIVEASAAEFVLVEEKLIPGRLQIVKLADRATALRGEVVSFVIRYDNLGDLPLQCVRIVDNLTPRLYYVNDSAVSDRPAKLIVEENGEGSVILTWELDEPLPGKSGGTVTFQARVR